MLVRLATAAAAVACATLLAPVSVWAQDACKGPKPVCDVRASVFLIQSFDPYGSAVRIGEDLLVTNRHVVADETEVKVRLANGAVVTGKVVPSAYEGDLVLVRAPLPVGPAMRLVNVPASGKLYTVGYDLSLRRVRSYPGGDLIAGQVDDKPFSRIHHTAYTQPGNSGGALVNAKGQLVGIVTGGGAGRFDAMPVAAIQALKAKSGDAFVVASKQRGLAYRQCALALEKRGPDAVAEVLDVCPTTDNRQYLDLAAQRAGTTRRFDQSIALSKKAIARDPKSVNSLVSLVETLRFAQRAKEAVPYARELLLLTPRNDRVQAMAIMIGRMGEAPDLVAQGVALVKRHYPERMPMIERMMQQPLTRN